MESLILTLPTFSALNHITVYNANLFKPFAKDKYTDQHCCKR